MNRNMKRLIMAAGLLAVLAGSMWVVAYFIPTGKYEALVMQAVKTATGHDIYVTGKPHLKLLPQPVLEIPNIELQTAEAGSRVPTLKIDSIRAYTTFGSILSGKPQVTSLVLVRPVIEIERGLDKVVQWDWLSDKSFDRMLALTSAPATPDGQVPIPPISEISIYDGAISYTNPRISYAEKWDSVFMTLTPGAAGAMTIVGNAGVRGHAVSFNLSVDAAKPDAANREAPFTLEIEAEAGNSLTVKGTRTVLDGKSQFKGDLSLLVTDLISWAPRPANPEPEAPAETGPVANAVGDLPASLRPDPKPAATFPLKLEAKLTQSGDVLELQEAKLDLVSTQGQGNIRATWEKMPDIDMQLGFGSFDVLQWYALAEGWNSELKEARNGRDEKSPSRKDDASSNPLADDVTMTFDIAADKVMFGASEWANVKLQAELADGTVTINQLTVAVAPESPLTVFGLISYVSRGLRFEGNMETTGKDLRSLMALFLPDASRLPARGMAEPYSFKSNMFISSQQLRISEAQLKIGDLDLIGGLVAYFEAKPRVEAEIRLQDINLDYFRDTWREEKMKERETGFALIQPPKYDFSWLKSLGTKLDFKVVIDRFTFLEKQGQTASFRIFADTGEIGLYGIKLLYPDSVLDGSLLLNVTGEMPMLDVIMTTNAFDTRYFVVNPRLAELPAPPPPPPPPGTPPEMANNKWSEDLFDMRWSSGWKAAFDLNIGELQFGDSVFDNFKLKAALENESLNIKKLSFGLWGGGFESAGTLILGKVPAASLSFTFYNAELRDMIASISNMDNLSGRMSVSGMITTSGINMLSWIQRATIKMVVAGRGVWVRGFNLQGVIDAVNAARSVADVINNVNLTITDGNTEFSVDGNINIQDGVMRTPGVTLRSGSVVGNLTGELRMIPWLLESSILFQFPSFPSETVPTMVLDLTGSGDQPSLKIDTSSLEAYVAKRIVGR